MAISVDVLQAFFGWCSVINIGVLLYATISMVLMRDFMTGLHAKLFGLEEKKLHEQYFQYLANYKIAIFMFNIVPYLALLIMN